MKKLASAAFPFPDSLEFSRSRMGEDSTLHTSPNSYRTVSDSPGECRVHLFSDIYEERKLWAECSLNLMGRGGSLDTSFS